MLSILNDLLKQIDNIVWGIPLIILILSVGIYLTIRLHVLQFTKLPKALKYMFQPEDGGSSEVSRFAALCIALSATIDTGNIIGVAKVNGISNGINNFFNPNNKHMVTIFGNDYSRRYYENQ